MQKTTYFFNLIFSKQTDGGSCRQERRDAMDRKRQMQKAGVIYMYAEHGGNDCMHR